MVPTLKRDIALVGLALMTWGVGEGMFFYFQPLYLEQLGASPVAIGSIIGGLGIAMTIMHIPAGYLADKIGRRPLLWIAWGTGMFATWIMALAQTLPYFIIGLLFYGLTSFVMSPLNSYITAARGHLSVGRVITLISAMYNIGAIIGPLIGGYIGESLGLRQIYLISAIIFVVSTIIILFIRSQPVEIPDSNTTKRGIPITKSYMIYLGVVFIVMFATFLPQPLSPNFLQNERGLQINQIGQLGSIASLGVVILSLIIGNFEAHRGFLVSQLAVGLFAILLWRGNGMGVYALAYFVIGGYRVVRSLATAQTRSLIDQARMGLAYGITETVGTAAIILSPLIAGFLYEINPVLIYPISTLLIFLSILLSARLIPKVMDSQTKKSYLPTPLE